MSNYIPNKKQVEAFNEVINAIEKAQKAGLVFYGKSKDLVAYTKSANDYVEKEHGFEKCLRGKGRPITCLSAFGLLYDSGADDYPNYISLEDSKKYGSI